MYGSVPQFVRINATARSPIAASTRPADARAPDSGQPSAAVDCAGLLVVDSDTDARGGAAVVPSTSRGRARGWSIGVQGLCSSARRMCGQYVRVSAMPGQSSALQKAVASAVSVMVDVLHW